MCFNKPVLSFTGLRCADAFTIVVHVYGIRHTCLWQLPQALMTYGTQSSQRDLYSGIPRYLQLLYMAKLIYRTPLKYGNMKIFIR